MSDETSLALAREPLTARQRQVLELIARGYTNGQIANELGITLDGAKWHVREILTKLGVEHREQAADWYQRRRSPVRQLQGAVRALFAPAVLKFAGGAAGAIAVLALAILAVAVFAGSNAETPPASGETAVSPTDEQSGTPDPGLDFGGVPVREWRVNRPEPVPEGLALYLETGCFGCEGAAGSIQRIVQMGSGDDAHLETETLFRAPGDESASIISLEPMPGGGTIFATACIQGQCGPLGEPSTDARSALYRSSNGGVTWLELESYDGIVAIAGVTSDGVVLVAGRSGTQSHYFVYETGQALPALAGSAVEPHTIGGELTLRSQDGQLVSSREQVLFDPPGSWEAWLAGRSDPAGARFVTSLSLPAAEHATTISGFVRDGQLAEVFTGPQVQVGDWLDDGRAVGNVVIQRHAVPAVGPATDEQWYSIPALIDFGAGTITPLEIDGLLFESETYRGRNTVIAAAEGRWVEVAGGDECVRLRARPALDGEVIGCYADGVLFDGGEETTEADGVTWAYYRAPDGLEGWASTEFLNR